MCNLHKACGSGWKLWTKTCRTSEALTGGEKESGEGLGEYPQLFVVTLPRKSRVQIHGGLEGEGLILAEALDHFVLSQNMYRVSKSLLLVLLQYLSHQALRPRVIEMPHASIRHVAGSHTPFGPWQSTNVQQWHTAACLLESPMNGAAVKCRHLLDYTVDLNLHALAKERKITRPKQASMTRPIASVTTLSLPTSLMMTFSGICSSSSNYQWSGMNGKPDSERG